MIQPVVQSSSKWWCDVLGRIPSASRREFAPRPCGAMARYIKRDGERRTSASDDNNALGILGS